jgi:hypothetical protein
VTKAVTDANKHSDTQFQAIQQNVGGVDKKVSAVGDSLSQTATSLSNDIQRTSDAIQKTSDRLDASIGKVGKPEPPIPARITFSLWTDNLSEPFPLLARASEPDTDGNYAVDFGFVDSSESTADSIDIWVQVCDGCSFAKEPPGFEKPAGMNEHVRHRMIGSLNPGVSFEKETISVKAPSDAASFAVEFRYSCKRCGGKIGANQVATIVKIPKQQ